MDDDEEESEVQNGCCTFRMGVAPSSLASPTRRQVLSKVVLAAAQKNKWEGNWLKYWFYAKIGFPDPEGSSEERFFVSFGYRGVRSHLSTCVQQACVGF